MFYTNANQISSLNLKPLFFKHTLNIYIFLISKCSNGCGRVCSNPVSNSKPGNCPAPSGFGICIQQCTFDNNCPGSQKCVNNQI